MYFILDIDIDIDVYFKKLTHTTFMHQDSLTAHPSLSPKEDLSFNSRLLISFPFKDDSSISRIPT